MQRSAAWVHFLSATPEFGTSTMLKKASAPEFRTRPLLLFAATMHLSSAFAELRAPALMLFAAMVKLGTATVQFRTAIAARWALAMQAGARHPRPGRGWPVRPAATGLPDAGGVA
jgi:hypothetical protein